MSVDITLQAEQAEIADSILGDNVIGTLKGDALVEAPAPEDQSQGGSNEALSDLHTDRESWRVENQEPDPFIVEEASRRNAETREQPVEQQAQPELTPQAIHERMQSLNTFVQENGLNDPNNAREFATELVGAFGSDLYKSGINVEQMGNVMAKATFSALNAYNACQGDLSRLAPIPQESARAFAGEFLRAWGIDPREVPVNERQLAETVFRGAASFIATYQRYGGKVSNIDQLNTPEAAEWFFSNFLQAFGAPPDVQVNRAVAIKFADAGAKYILGMINKLGQMQPQAPQRRGGVRSQGQRQRNGRTWRTNNDIFTPDIMERLELEKATRKGSQEFAPKQRRAASQFRSNQDIFNEDTLADYQRL